MSALSVRTMVPKHSFHVARPGRGQFSPDPRLLTPSDPVNRDPSAKTTTTQNLKLEVAHCFAPPWLVPKKSPLR